MGSFRSSCWTQGRIIILLAEARGWSIKQIFPAEGTSIVNLCPVRSMEPWRPPILLVPSQDIHRTTAKYSNRCRTHSVNRTEHICAPARSLSKYVVCSVTRDLLSTLLLASDYHQGYEIYLHRPIDLVPWLRKFDHSIVYFLYLYSSINHSPAFVFSAEEH